MSSDNRLSWRNWVGRDFILGGPVVAIFGALFEKYLIEPNISAIGDFVAPALEYSGTIIFQVVCAVLTLGIGTLLYFLRCQRMRLYASLEIAIGILTAIFVANQISAGVIVGAVAVPSISTAAFAELAALYIIVRGYDNYHKSLTGDAKEKWEGFFFN
jgi:hypothetical protein